jgi:hypothetical protein
LIWFNLERCLLERRPVVSVDNNAYYLNEECRCTWFLCLASSDRLIDYLLAHSSRIVIPRDSGAQFASRIGVTLGGNLSWTLGVQAYMTPRNSSSAPAKYGLVVINWYDNASTTWNPQPVSATIAFRGMQVSCTNPPTEFLMY